MIGYPPHLHGLTKFAFEFHGTYEECKAIYNIMGGGYYNTTHEVATNGGTWRWNLRGKKAEDFSEEMLPLLQQINSSKAKHCIGYVKPKVQFRK